MRTIIAAISLSLASPSLAAATPPPAKTIPAANLEVAEAVIDLVWPVGTLKRVMDATMSGMMEQMMDGAMDMTIGQAAALNGEDVEGTEADKTLRDAAIEADPHFDERMKLSMDVFYKEFSVLLVEMEPEIRRIVTQLYAKRFTMTELQDMRTFFATPSGRRYAAESLTMMQDPEFVAATMSFQPMLMEKMPEIMKKMDEVTAHLPPPPKVPEADEEGAVEQQLMDVLEEPAEETYVPIEEAPDALEANEAPLDAADTPIS